MQNVLLVQLAAKDFCRPDTYVYMARIFSVTVRRNDLIVYLTIPIYVIGILHIWKERLETLVFTRNKLDDKILRRLK